MIDTNAQPSPGVQYLLQDLHNTKFQLAAALDLLVAKDARIAELEKPVEQPAPKRNGHAAIERSD